MPGKRRGKKAGGKRAGGKGKAQAAPKVYVTAEAKAMVRQALMVDRHLLLHKGKAFDRFIARFEKIDEFPKMRDFLEAKKGVLPNGYCVRERLSEMGHAQIQVALYNGTGWNDLSIGALLAMSKFNSKLTKARAAMAAAAAAAEAEAEGQQHDEQLAEQPAEAAEAAEAATRQLAGLSEEAAAEEASADEARAQEDSQRLGEEAAAAEASAARAQEEKKSLRSQRRQEEEARDAERLRIREQQEQARRQKAVLAQKLREQSSAGPAIVDSGGPATSRKPDYKDYSGPDDAAFSKEYGAKRRAEAIAAAENRRSRAVELAKQRREKAVAEAEALATKTEEAAEALAAETAAMRQRNAEKRRAASHLAARRNAAQKIGRARVAWQQEQTWLIAKDAAINAAEQEAEQRQRLRRRVHSTTTHPSARPQRPSSAPAGGRPNRPLSEVPASEGGIIQLNHPVLRYGSRHVFSHAEQAAGNYGVYAGGEQEQEQEQERTTSVVRTGFCPSTPRPPSTRPHGGHGGRPTSATTSRAVDPAGAGSSVTPAWAF